MEKKILESFFLEDEDWQDSFPSEEEEEEEEDLNEDLGIEEDNEEDETE